MKRILGLFVLLSLCLCACAGPGGRAADKAAAFAAGVDISALPDCRQASLHQSYVETEQGMYVLSDKSGANGGLVWFLPRGEDVMVPLCDKPNCEHRNHDCNAWGGFVLAEYGGKLYTELLEYESTLISMDMDGTNHESVARLPVVKNPDGGFEGSGGLYPAGTYLVYIMAANLMRPYEEQHCHIFLFDLTQGKWHEAFTSLTQQYHLNLGDPLYADGKLYCITDVEQEGGETESWMLMLDLETEEWELLFEMNPKFYMWAVYDGILYYLIPDVGFREYNLETGELADKGLPVEDALWASYGEDYIYLMGHNPILEDWEARAEAGERVGFPPPGEETLYILNWNYELVDQVFLTDGEHPTIITADRIYFTYDTVNLNKPNAWLDKSKIGSGNLELIPLE